jgi:23S rRNA (uracil1939-C5)-methyltransferase
LTEATAVRPGDRIEIEISKGVYRGLGLGRHEGQVVLVRSVYPGERWRVRVTEVGRGYVRAEREQSLASIPARRESPCAVFPRCGGCAHQDLDYDSQLALKRAVLEDALSRAGVTLPADTLVHGSPERGWRTRASLQVEASRGLVRLGFHEPESHRLVEFETCLQLSDATNLAVKELRAALRRRGGLAARLRRIELTESIDADERTVALVGELDARDASLLEGMQGELPSLGGLGLLSARDERQRFVPVWGEPHVVSRVRGVALRVHALSFFQANRFLVERMVDEVERRMPAGLDVLDLYGGVGLFAIALAGRAPAVTCVEVDAHAVHDARANVRAAGCENVHVLRSDVTPALGSLPLAKSEGVVVDPPRTGLGPEVVEALVRRQPRPIVYVSCDPPTFARDLKRLVASGYRLVDCVALDLFPDTFHVETVALLDHSG